MGVSITGEMVGPSVGSARFGEAVGSSVGSSLLGEAVGSSVGSSLFGASVGKRVGSSLLGATVGSSLFGAAVGPSLIGAAVGSNVGTSITGEEVGSSWLGASDGVGSIVGVSILEDLDVGSSVYNDRSRWRERSEKQSNTHTDIWLVISKDCFQLTGPAETFFDGTADGGVAEKTDGAAVGVTPKSFGGPVHFTLSNAPTGSSAFNHSFR